MTGGIFNEAKSFSNLSKPRETTRRVKDATQNHTRTVNTKNFATPAEVMAKVKSLKFAEAIVCPGVMKMMGMEINAAKAGIQTVLERRYFKETLEATAKTKGTMQINAKYGREKMKREATIMKTTATRLISGLMLCNKPRLLLKSST